MTISRQCHNRGAFHCVSKKVKRLFESGEFFPWDFYFCLWLRALDWSSQVISLLDSAIHKTHSNKLRNQYFNSILKNPAGRGGFHSLRAFS